MVLRTLSMKQKGEIFEIRSYTMDLQFLASKVYSTIHTVMPKIAFLITILKGRAGVQWCPFDRRCAHWGRRSLPFILPQGVSCRHPDRESTKPSFVAQNHSFSAFNFTNCKRYYMQYRSFWPSRGRNPNYLIFIWNKVVFVKKLVKYRSHQFCTLTYLFTWLLILGESDTIVTVFEKQIDWYTFISKW